ncbi:MAG: N-acetylneuraminate synthase family protein [Chloroflexi bacterium]|nr:N-acetylneuraminate synthase family protein [Chloroflexota bacterium]
MGKSVQIGEHVVGPGHPCYIVAEIGINHNGDLAVARQLIDAAASTGCDAVKFQKRTPELCVPPEQRDVMRETPWGAMTYLEYRHRVEFGESDYRSIAAYCSEKNIDWFASCWDMPSIDFMEAFDPPCYKVASASLTDDALLEQLTATSRPIILSTGMSTLDEIRHAVALLPMDRLLLTHATSAYPCRPEDTNLNMIQTLESMYPCPIGYSGHEIGLQITLAAVALGACLVERHITLDRAMWGSDQSASVEPQGWVRLVRDIRIVEKALGDGIKTVYEAEQASRKKLRG